MKMATAQRTNSPAERLRSLVDVDVTLVTTRGTFRGSILNCTRLSVWLIGADDDDAVIPLDEILDIGVSEPATHAA